MPETTDTPPATKPGIKTTEFWLSKIAIVLSALFAANVIPTSGVLAKVAIIAAITLTTLGYQVTRGMVKAAMLLLVAGLALSQTTACGGTSKRDTTIHTTVLALDVADQELHAFSVAHEHSIIDRATDLEAGRAELAAFRLKVDHARDVIKAGYRAAAIATLVNDDRSLSSLVQVAADVSDELHELGVLKP